MNVIEVKNLVFNYKTTDFVTPVLKSVNFDIRSGEMVAIKGPSGSGKSTLLYILGGMLSYQEGDVKVLGKKIDSLTPFDKAMLRNQNLGFIFQQFHLLPKSTILENILLPTRYPIEVKKKNVKENIERAKYLATMLGLEEKLDTYPNKLSGGQQQRVAIARALMNDAKIILADEPTGNLDSVSSGVVIEHLKKLNKEEGKTVVIITHDNEVANECDRILTLRDGVLVEEKKDLEFKEAKILETKDHKLTNESFFRFLFGLMTISFKNIFQHKIRSFLTMIGIVVGISAVLAMVTLGEFTQEKILKSYAELGVNSMVISGYQNWEMKATDQFSVSFESFDLDKDIYYLKEVFPEIDKMTPILFDWGSIGASFAGRVIDSGVSIMGGNEFLSQILNRKIVKGKDFSPYHIEYANPVCLIGYEVYTRLFKNSDPIGKIINLANKEGKVYGCQVIGVLEHQSVNNQWRKPDMEVYVPFTYYSKNIGNFWSSAHHRFSMMVKPGTDMKKMQTAILNFFKIKYGKSGKFWADNDSALIAQMKKFLTLFTILLTAIAMVSLIVGGIGITNMMLVSVSERIKEIGLRKAIGATDDSVKLQYLMESLILCIFAGVIGLILGVGSYQMAIYIGSELIPTMEFEWVFNLKAITLSFLSIFVVGIFSGLIPSIKAEKLEVIEALRND